MSLHRSDAVTVHQDYGQFALITGDMDDDDLVELVDAANGADGIAQGNAILVVLSPHQNNLALGLTVEQWGSRPPDDLDAWQEGFEASLTVGDLGLVYMSPTDSFVQLDVPPAAYRARIVGRGFVNRGWPGSTTPGDVWRIQLWPCSERTAPRRIARWETPSDR